MMNQIDPNPRPVYEEVMGAQYSDTQIATIRDLLQQSGAGEAADRLNHDTTIKLFKTLTIIAGALPHREPSSPARDFTLTVGDWTGGLSIDTGLWLKRMLEERGIPYQTE